VGGFRVRRVLDRIASDRGPPEAIVLDNVPEFCGRALAAWSEERGVRLESIPAETKLQLRTHIGLAGKLNERQQKALQRMFKEGPEVSSTGIFYSSTKSPRSFRKICGTGRSGMLSLQRACLRSPKIALIPSVRCGSE
jgi:hypothetical protein